MFLSFKLPKILTSVCSTKDVKLKKKEKIHFFCKKRREEKKTVSRFLNSHQYGLFDCGGIFHKHFTLVTYGRNKISWRVLKAIHKSKKLACSGDCSLLLLQ
jgi:hypothetical protein